MSTSFRRGLHAALGGGLSVLRLTIAAWDVGLCCLFQT